MARKWLLGSFVLALLAFPAAAQAQAGQVNGKRAPEVSYDAPPSCPSQEQFATAVRSRGGKLDEQAASAAPKALSISIRALDGGYTGTLRVQEDGDGAVREVKDPDCAQVADGLAVIAAIALGGSGEETPEPTQAKALAPTAEASPAPAPRKPDSAEKQVEHIRVRGSSYSSPSSVPVTEGTLRFGGRRDFTLLGGASFNLVPGLVVPRFDFSIDLTRYAILPSGQALLGPQILQVRWSFLGPATHRAGDYKTDLWGIRAGIASCNALSYDSDGLELLLCADFAVGAMNLKTHRPDGSVKERDAGFGVAGISFEPRYNLGSLVHLDLRVGGELQLGDISASREDGSRLFGSSLFGGYALFGVGLHF